jgi:ABC-type Na+ efflux pump permease subunit
MLPVLFVLALFATITLIDAGGDTSRLVRIAQSAVTGAMIVLLAGAAAFALVA